MTELEERIRGAKAQLTTAQAATTAAFRARDKALLEARAALVTYNAERSEGNGAAVARTRNELERARLAVAQAQAAQIMLGDELVRAMLDEQEGGDVRCRTTL
jgi:hypothetical protein